MNQAIIREQRLQGERIRIDDDQLVAVSRCHLIDCTVILDATDDSGGILNSKLDNCVIEVNKKRKRTSFFGSDFRNCGFKGLIRNADFGRSRPDDPLYSLFNSLGSIVDCDFTQATLDMCRFFEVDLGRQKFAPWPQFVIPHERELAAAALKREWPGKIWLYLMVAAQDQRTELSGVTGTLSYFVKNYQVTEEELLQVLDEIGGVLR